jgi:hypothetical protein
MPLSNTLSDKSSGLVTAKIVLTSDWCFCLELNYQTNYLFSPENRRNGSFMSSTNQSLDFLP